MSDQNSIWSRLKRLGGGRKGRADGPFAKPGSHVSSRKNGPGPETSGAAIPPGRFDDDAPLHLNATLSEAVRRAEARVDRDSTDPEYVLTRDNLDKPLYLMRRRDMLRAARLDVVHHFMTAGHKENRIPASYFSPKLYRQRYPEAERSGMSAFAHWLAEGRDRGEIAYPIRQFDALCDILGAPAAEVQEELIALHGSVRHRLLHGTLGEMVAKAAALDPLIEHSWPAAMEPKIAPFHSDEVAGRIVALHALQVAAAHQRARFVLVVNRPRWGAGKRMEGYIAEAAEALGAAPRDIVVLTTEEGGTHAPGKFSDDVRHVDFSTLAGGLGPAHRLRVMAEFLRSLRPEAVFNINSKTMWDTVHAYGPALRQSFKLIQCMFCNEQTELGFWTGYPVKWFYRAFDVSAAVGVDSQHLADELSERFLIPPSQRHKLVVLPAPVDPGIAVQDAPTVSGEARRPQIFWAGRLDRQKRVDILFKVAAALPEYDFRVWGAAFIDAKLRLPRKPANVTLEGMYDHLGQMDLAAADAWLYTSQWDGVPSILLEIAMTGIPLVGTRVGGTQEVFLDGFTGPVDDIENVAAYVAALRAVIEDPVAARAQARALRQHLVETRTRDLYRARVAALLAAEGGRHG